MWLTQVELIATVDATLSRGIEQAWNWSVTYIVLIKPPVNEYPSLNVKEREAKGPATILKKKGNKLASFQFISSWFPQWKVHNGSRIYWNHCPASQPYGASAPQHLHLYSPICLHPLVPRITPVRWQLLILGSLNVETGACCSEGSLYTAHLTGKSFLPGSSSRCVLLVACLTPTKLPH